MPNDFASGERARGIHYLPNRRTIMSPPPRKSSKGKSKCAPDHWSPLPFRGRVSFRHRLLAMQSKRVKHAGRYANKLPLLCLCLSSFSPPIQTCRSHHLRLGRYHLPLVVCGSIQGRYLLGPTPSCKYPPLVPGPSHVGSNRTAIFRPKILEYKKFSCLDIFECWRAWRQLVKARVQKIFRPQRPSVMAFLPQRE